MTIFNPSRINARSTILAALSAMMFLSLTCSMAISADHSDSPIADTAEEVQPLEVGDKAPRFVVQSVDGANVDFDPTSLERPVIIMTFRGGWCPYCNMHLSELRHVIPEIQDLDVDVMFLSGDRPDQLYSSLSDEAQSDIDGLGYEIYSDANASAAIALGIAFRVGESTLNRRKEKGQDVSGSSMAQHGVLPVPAVYAIGTDGMISYAFVEANYRVRLEADKLLQVATSLQ